MIALPSTLESADHDAQLMARVAEGEVEYFDELMQRNESLVRGLVVRMKGPLFDSDDLTQQVFLQAYRARHSYCPTAKFTTWLFVITRNVVLNAQRTISRRHEIELLSPHLVEASEYAGSSLTSGTHPVDQIIRQEIQQAVSGAIDKLPQRQRQAIELVGLDGCRYKVAARQMKVTEKAIKSLVHRAKMNLRVLLETDYPSHVA